MENLTKKQRTIFEYLIAGWSRKDLADELDMSIGTVHTMVQTIVNRSKTANIVEATYKYTKAGII